ncbi:hypothetical protein [Bradyrhizobium sp. USDA 3458]|uniref:hypothetical protein n=1 Tax=Bradyrhizobium sp. USDA 3458 TaxID=2591461 RepID=UPI0011438D5F|nr:hypothetical protein [Bradyrhizobium sp. USDA 3458]
MSLRKQASLETISDNSEWAALFPEEVQRIKWTHRLANLVTRRINTQVDDVLGKIGHGVADVSP